MSLCSHKLNYHADVGVVAPDNGDVLTWDTDSGMWIPSPGGGSLTPHALSYHSDVTSTVPTTNQVLGYNGSQWTPMSIGAAGPLDLNDLADVVITTVADGDNLTYDSGTGNWVNTALGALPAHDLEDHADVIITAPVNGQSLTYSAGTWINSTASDKALNDLTDVSAGSPSVGQTIVWNGTAWINTTLGATGAHNLNFHTDVSVPSPTNGQVLTWNGSNWVAATPLGYPALNNVTDVTITTPATGQALIYNGSQWVNSSNTVTSSVEASLGFLRGTLTKAASGSTWAITEGSGFTIAQDGTGRIVTVTFSTAFADVPTPTTSANAVRVANGGDTFDFLNPAATAISTTALELTEQWHSANNNIETGPGTTAADDLVIHFIVLGPR